MYLQIYLPTNVLRRQNRISWKAAKLVSYKTQRAHEGEFSFCPKKKEIPRKKKETKFNALKLGFKWIIKKCNKIYLAQLFVAIYTVQRFSGTGGEIALAQTLQQ